MSTTTTLSAASIFPRKISRATASPRWISPSAKPLSAFANFCVLKRIVRGDATKKAPRFSNSSSGRAAAPSGFWCARTALCWPASSLSISPSLANACGSRKRKKCCSSQRRASAASRKRISLKNVIVIGGGLAGLAASVALAEAGWRVRLFEQRPFLGGRAASYVLPDGEHVDNCQHVTFGCCTNLEDFYRRVGSAGKIKFFDRLLLLDPQGRRGEMHAGILPAPFHMTGSFLTFSPLGWKDKLCIARAFYSILQSGGHPRDADEPGGITRMAAALQYGIKGTGDAELVLPAERGKSEE